MFVDLMRQAKRSPNLVADIFRADASSNFA
jgi:hypothetical protein